MSYFDRYKDISELNGRALVSVAGLVEGSEEVTFSCADGTTWKMYHSQDCCESVNLYDIVGDVADLSDATVIAAREETNCDTHPDDYKPEWRPDSFTWTFYVIQTNKGAVTLRWLGESNGYYSESVSFVQVSA